MTASHWWLFSTDQKSSHQSLRLQDISSESYSHTFPKASLQTPSESRLVRCTGGWAKISLQSIVDFITAMGSTDRQTLSAQENKERSQHHPSLWLNQLVWAELLDPKKLIPIWWFCVIASAMDISVAVDRNVHMGTEWNQGPFCKHVAWNIKKKNLHAWSPYWVPSPFSYPASSALSLGCN